MVSRLVIAATAKTFADWESLRNFVSSNYGGDR
jgi:hypothetical protein